MNWIKQNTFLSGLIAITLIGAIGLGYLLLKAKGSYNTALDSYREAASQKARLEGMKPYPDEENEAKLVQAVSQYKTTADELRRQMLKLQAPLPEAVTPSKFQESLRSRVDEIIGLAEAKGVQLGEGFFLGMDDYRQNLPLMQAAARLQFQLDATAWLANMILSNEADKLDIKRRAMPFEKAAAAEEPAGRDRPKGRRQGDEKPVAEVYPMEVSFSASPAGFQRILNNLSNTQASLDGNGGPGEEYYFVTQFLRIENQRQGGPERSDVLELVPQQRASSDTTAEGDGEAAEAEEAQGSLNMIFGSETVRAYLALDLVRLTSPSAEEN
jgi:hypothetical protein